MKAKFLIYAFVVILGSWACKSGTKQEAKDIIIDQVIDKETVVEEVIGYPMPTAFEVTTLLNEAGAPFIIGIVNPVENADKYVSTKDKAINLGIYGADLSYASTYILKQETMSYLKISKRLIDELEISSAFNQNYAQRVEDNIENRDSLISIITDSFYDTYKYLRTNEQDLTSVYVLTGSWVESVYLISQIIIVSQDKAPFIDILVNQDNSLDQLLNVIEPVKDDPGIVDIYNQLMTIKTVYSSFGENVGMQQVDELTIHIEKLHDSLI